MVTYLAQQGYTARRIKEGAGEREREARGGSIERCWVDGTGCGLCKTTRRTRGGWETMSRTSRAAGAGEGGMVSVRSEEGEGEGGGTEAATASSPHATRPDGNRAGHTSSTHGQTHRHLPAPPHAAAQPWLIMRIYPLLHYQVTILIPKTTTTALPAPRPTPAVVDVDITAPNAAGRRRSGSPIPQRRT